MSRIRITRKHGLGYEAARRMADRLAEDLRDELDAECHWDDSKLVFTRKGADGWLEIGEDQVDLEIRLGLMLTPMKPAIERVVREKLDRIDDGPETS